MDGEVALEAGRENVMENGVGMALGIEYDVVDDRLSKSLKSRSWPRAKEKDPVKPRSRG